MAVRLRENNLTWRRTGDEIVVLDLDASTYFSLNGSGALLWEAVSSADCDREQLQQQLQQAYGIDAEQARVDVDQFLTTLREHRLVEG